MFTLPAKSHRPIKQSSCIDMSAGTQMTQLWTCEVLGFWEAHDSTPEPTFQSESPTTTAVLTAQAVYHGTPGLRRVQTPPSGVGSASPDKQPQPELGAALYSVACFSTGLCFWQWPSLHLTLGLQPLKKYTFRSLPTINVFYLPK